MIMTEKLIETEDGKTLGLVWSGEVKELEPAMCPRCIDERGNMKPCAGHTCAAWRWASTSTPRDIYDPFWDKSELLRGYCGLAGVPLSLR